VLKFGKHIFQSPDDTFTGIRTEYPITDVHIEVFYSSDRPVQGVGLGCSPAGVVGPNPTGGMDVCLV
jgi:hypothetical protein